MNIWKHGKYLDTWSSVHFLSGFILIGLFYKFDYELFSALVFSFLLLILWEIFEWVTKIIEPSMNVIFDIIVGLIGCFFGIYLFYFLNESFATYFYPVLIINFFLALWGFIDFLKRGYR